MFGLPEIKSLSPILKVGQETVDSTDIFHPVSRRRARGQGNIREMLNKGLDEQMTLAVRKMAGTVTNVY